MDAPQLNYAGPRAPAIAPQESGPLKVGTMLVVVAVIVFFGIKFEDVMSDRSRKKVARHAAAKTDVEMLARAVRAFQQDLFRFPTDAEGLNALASQPVEAEPWMGPYLKRGVPVDPWGNAYVYHVGKPRSGETYTVLSRGPDGVEGTSDDVVNP